MANGQPNNPALYTIPSGDESGDDTIKATIGAQGIVLAIMPNTTAVVPHEHKGVPTAAAVAATTPDPRWRFKNADIFSALTYRLSSTAMITLMSRNGQLCKNASAVCLIASIVRFKM